jgi:hypothetical protein
VNYILITRLLKVLFCAIFIASKSLVFGQYVIEYRPMASDSLLIDSVYFEIDAECRCYYKQYFQGELINAYIRTNKGIIKIDKWYYFDRNGLVRKTGNYNMNMKYGYWTFYSKGKLKKVIYYKDDVRIKVIRTNSRWALGALS